MTIIFLPKLELPLGDNISVGESIISIYFIYTVNEISLVINYRNDPRDTGKLTYLLYITSSFDIAKYGGNVATAVDSGLKYNLTSQIIIYLWGIYVYNSLLRDWRNRVPLVRLEW